MTSDAFPTYFLLMGKGCGARNKGRRLSLGLKFTSPNVSFQPCYFLGSGPDRGRSPVEWGEIPSVRPSVRPSVPPLAGPQTLLAGPQTLLAGPQTPPARPQTPLASPQTTPASSQTPQQALTPL